MTGHMSETAAGPPLSEVGPDPDGSGHGHERAGVIAFVVVAVVATAAWLVLLGWLISLAVRELF